MSDLITEDEDIAAARISATLRLQLPSASTDDIERLGLALTALWSTPVETIRSPRARPSHIATFQFVIRDEDLKLLDSILDGVKAAAGAGFLLAPVAPVAASIAAVGIAASLLKLLYNAAMKGVKLDTLDYAVLTTVATAKEGLTAQQLVEKVAAKNLQLTPDEAGAVLKRLSEARSYTGKIALVWQRDDIWRTTGV